MVVLTTFSLEPLDSGTGISTYIRMMITESTILTVVRARDKQCWGWSKPDHSNYLEPLYVIAKPRLSNCAKGECKVIKGVPMVYHGGYAQVDKICATSAMEATMNVNHIWGIRTIMFCENCVLLRRSPSSTSNSITIRDSTFLGSSGFWATFISVTTILLDIDCPNAGPSTNPEHILEIASFASWGTFPAAERTDGESKLDVLEDISGEERGNAYEDMMRGFEVKNASKLFVNPRLKHDLRLSDS